MARPKKIETVAPEIIEEEVTVKETQPKAKKKKEFAPHDLITCRSITCGELFMVGAQSKLLYKWADMESEYDVEYQDLVYDVRSTNSFAKYPRFIVLDDDFVEQNGLDKVYEKVFQQGDIKDILKNTPTDQLENVIMNLPKGAQDSVKIMAATLISAGQLDSVQKIKILDKIFNTQMLLHLANN